MGVKIKKKKIEPACKALEDLIQNHDLPPMAMFVATNNKDVLEEEKDKIQNFQEELLKKHAEVDERSGRIKRSGEENEDGLTEDVMFQSEEDRESYIEIMQEVMEKEQNLSLEKVDTSEVESVEAPPGIIFAVRWMFK